MSSIKKPMTRYQALKALFLPLFLCLGLMGEAEAQLQVAVEVNPDPAMPGSILYVRLTVSNTSSSASGSVRVQMEYPEGLQPLNDILISDGGDCTNLFFPGECNAGEVMFWNLGVIGPGQGRTLTFPPVAAEGAAAGAMIPFEAEVLEDDALRNSAAQNIGIVAESPLGLSVDADREPVLAGGLLNYALTVGNSGASSVRNTVLQFPLPDGTVFVSASRGAAVESGFVRWNLGTFFSGQNSRFEVAVRVRDDNARGTLLQVRAATLSAELNFEITQARAKAVTRVGDLPDLVLSLESAADPIRPGEQLQTRLTVANVSTSVITGVVVELRFPGYLDALNDVLLSDGGDCTNFFFSGECNNREVAFWNVGLLGPGRGATVFLGPWPRDDTPDGALVRLRARAFGDGVPEAWERRTVAVSADRLLNLAIDPSQEPVAPGGRFSYMLSVANRGEVASRDTMLRFPLPSGTTFVSASGGGIQESEDVLWDLGTLPAGEGHRFEVIVDVEPTVSLGSVLQSDVGVLTGTADLFPQETRTAVALRVESQPVLSLAVEPNLDPIRPEELLETRLTVANQSNEPLTGVVLLLQYPSYLDATADVLLSNGGDCTNFFFSGECNNFEFVIWNLGSLGPGGGRTVSLPSFPREGTRNGTLIPLRARVSSDFTTAVWERRSVLVDQARPLNLRVDVDRNPVEPGDLINYQFTFANRGPSQVDHGRLRFPLPTGTRLVSANGRPGLENGLINWDIGMLAPGEGGQVRATLEVDSALPGGVVLESEPTILTAEADLLVHEARANPTTRTEPGIGVEVALRVDSKSFQAGQSIPVQVIVTNSSDSILTGVTARLFFPVFLNPVRDGQISDGGDCTNLFFSGECNSLESVIWDLGNLAPGSLTAVSLPPVIRPNTPTGELIRFFATVSDDASERSFTSMTPLVGTLNGDPNGDGNADIADLAAVINRILTGQIDPASDCTGDGMLNVQDAQCILDLIRN